MKMKITTYKPEYKDAIIELWRKCDLTRPQNDPAKDIERKLKVSPEMFLVGMIDGKVIATVMYGYDGHRGWVNYLGVDPELQKKGLGRQMMDAVEKKLRPQGCPKINLQVRKGNMNAMKFYERIGYQMDEVIGMGKRLIED